ncbi:hypothetical protein DRQ25_13445 [Candidatus Fermentibacteria bacterium]|nr:MAG: hypothetical protein DRQ25_13445 [Candidatus Fermentibacteria bacterium]
MGGISQGFLDDSYDGLYSKPEQKIVPTVFELVDVTDGAEYPEGAVQFRPSLWHEGTAMEAARALHALHPNLKWPRTIEVYADIDFQFMAEVARVVCYKFEAKICK